MECFRDLEALMLGKSATAATTIPLEHMTRRLDSGCVGGPIRQPQPVRLGRGRCGTRHSARHQMSEAAGRGTGQEKLRNLWRHYYKARSGQNRRKETLSMLVAHIGRALV